MALLLLLPAGCAVNSAPKEPAPGDLHLRYAGLPAVSLDATLQPIPEADPSLVSASFSIDYRGPRKKVEVSVEVWIDGTLKDRFPKRFEIEPPLKDALEIRVARVMADGKPRMRVRVYVPSTSNLIVYAQHDFDDGVIEGTAWRDFAPTAELRIPDGVETAIWCLMNPDAERPVLSAETFEAVAKRRKTAWLLKVRTVP